jgi:hypothetical protein
MRLAERKAEKGEVAGVVMESATPDGPSGWQEMMALLLHTKAAWPPPEEQTCTECDSDSGGRALPPEDYLG